MAQLQDIQKAQQSLEQCVTKKMEELQAQLQTGTAKDTVAKVAEEFRTFRDLTFAMLKLLRQQIAQCITAVDTLETRQRQKMLIFTGLPEQTGDNCITVLLNIIHNKLLLNDVTVDSIQTCHRLGTANKDHHRPILVKFFSKALKAAVWRAKSKLKGSTTSIKEFLTKARQEVFGKARQHFGVRGCWTQDGTIVIKPIDGSRHKITSLEHLQPLLDKYPKVPAGTPKTSSR